MRWQPDFPMGSACDTQRRKWHAAITRHEEAHVADNRRLEKAYNRAARKQRYVETHPGCGGSLTSASGVTYSDAPMLPGLTRHALIKGMLVALNMAYLVPG
jgi:hypothetical protein